MSGPKLGTTLYSLTPEFHSRRYSFPELVTEVGRRGLGPGLEIVGFQSIKGFPEVTREFELEFKRLVDEHGLEPSCLGANVDIGRHVGSLMNEDELVAYLEPQLRAASRLGFPVVRIQFAATPRVVARLVPTAERLGVAMGMEIHSPHSVSHPVILALRELYDRLQTPAVGFIPDFGASVVRQPPLLFEAFRRHHVPQPGVDALVEAWSAPGDPFERRNDLRSRLQEMRIAEDHVTLLMKGMGLFGRQEAEAWAEIGPSILHVHGKFFEITDGVEPAVPYPRLMRTLVDCGFEGFVSSEWEGWHWIDDRDGFSLLEQHHRLVRSCIEDALETRADGGPGRVT